MLLLLLLPLLLLLLLDEGMVDVDEVVRPDETDDAHDMDRVEAVEILEAEENLSRRDGDAPLDPPLVPSGSCCRRILLVNELEFAFTPSCSNPCNSLSILRSNESKRW